MNIEKEKEAFESTLKQIGKVDDSNFTVADDGSYEWDSIHFAWTIWQAAKAQAVQEGFVLVSKDKLHEWKCMARRSEELGCPDCYESRGYSHNLAEEIQSEGQSK